MNYNKIIQYKSKAANSSTIWILFLLLGWSYGSLGKIGLQILFYITFGGFGIWTFIRLFTLNRAIKKYNRKVAASLSLSIEEQMILNLY